MSTSTARRPASLRWERWLRTSESTQHRSQSEAVPWYRSPMFLGVLGIKLALAATLASSYATQLFLPTLNYFVESGFSDPWRHFAALGRLNAFPYPPLMLYVMSVGRLLLHPWLSAGTETVTWLHLLALRIPLLAADITVLAVLLKWFPDRKHRVLALYWASPVALYINYWHGQLDVVPMALLIVALYCLSVQRLALGMVIYGLSLATKTHVLCALPLIVLYVYQERGPRFTLQALAITACTYAVSISPYVGDPAFRTMVYGTAEQLRLVSMRFVVGNAETGSAQFLLAPAVLLALVARFSVYPKWNWDLLMMYTGLLFCVFVLVSPPAPGYYYWSLPFVVYFICRDHRAAVGLYWGFAASYLAFQFFRAEYPAMAAFGQVAPQWANLDLARYIGTTLKPAGASAADLAFTAMTVALSGMTYSMYRFGVRSNSVYRVRETPVMLGIAGDSGAGKDSFVGGFAQVFGDDKTTLVSGDDYHRWPRGHEMWQVHTHLDVRANDLYRKQQDAVALGRGQRVLRVTYDHQTGTFTEGRPLDPKAYVMVSGLHSLALDSLRRIYDLSIFLDPEESLRKDWKLRRDTEERNHSTAAVLQSIEQRRPDREKFILPQREYADVVLSYRRRAPDTQLGLEVLLRNSFDLTSVVNALSESGLEVQHDPFVDPTHQSLSVTGEISSERLARIAAENIPNLEELALRPVFRSNAEGCAQLIALSCLSERLRWYA